MIALPLTILILLLVLGSLVAAFVPVLVGLTSVFATMGLVAIVSQFVPMDGQIQEVVLLIGLAVGVDYTLFYLRRERDERKAGRGERAALEAAAATSGRAVLISGFTVMIAMAGMFFSGQATFVSFAIGTMMVVGVAMIGSLTVLPAVLSRLGDKVEKGRIPFLHRLRRDTGEGSRFWGAILKPVLRHPAISAVAAAAVLVVLAVPALSLHTADNGLNALPKSQPELKAFHVLDKAFPGGASAATVAIKSKDTPADPRGDRRPEDEGPRIRRGAEPDRLREERRRHGVPESRSRSPATARTRSPTTRSRLCAARSCLPRSAPCRVSSTPSPAAPPSRLTSTRR